MRLNTRNAVAAKREEIPEALNRSGQVRMERSPDEMDELKSAVDRDLAVIKRSHDSRLLRCVETALWRRSRGRRGVSAARRRRTPGTRREGSKADGANWKGIRLLNSGVGVTSCVRVEGVNSMLIDERKDPAVLVVSDDDDVSSQVEKYLAGSGYPILRASNYEEAAGAFSRLAVAVIVSEAELGPRSWRDVAAFSSEVSRPPYLIVISELASKQLWREVLEGGGVNLFAKSTTMESGLRVALETSLMDWTHLP